MPGDKITQEQEKLLALKKEDLNITNEITKGLKELVAHGIKLNDEQQKTLDAFEDELKAQERLKSAKADQVDFEKKLHKMRRKGNAELNASADLSEDITNRIMAAADEAGELSETQEEFLGIVKDLSGELKSTAEIDKIIADLGDDITQDMEDYLMGQREIASIGEKQKSVMGAIDDLTGGMATKAKDFAAAMANNPLEALLTVAVAILKDFSGKLDAIGEQFGAIGVKEFSQDLMLADAEMAKLGYDAGTAGTITETLTSQFGVGLSDAIGMSVAVCDMSKALGLSVEEGAGLVGMFTEMGGMTAEQAVDMTKMTAQLAQQNNVNPGQVLKDIQKNTELYARFGADGTEEMVKSATHAAKLGVSLDTVAGTMEAMLDFAGSTQKAMEASVMTGRNINIQKLQELSLAGDATGVLEEQKKLLGDQADFNNLNWLEQKKLAEAIGLSHEEAIKMVNKQGEAADLAGELEKKEGFEGLVGKEALSALTQLQNMLTSIAATFTAVIGPSLNFVIGLVTQMIDGFTWLYDALWLVTTPLEFMVSVIGEGISVFSTMIGWLMEFPPIAAAVGVALIAMNAKFLITAISGVWAGVTSIMSIPFVGPVLAAIAAAGLISTIYKAVSGAKSKSVGDLKTGPGGGGPVVTTSQGSMEGSVRDEVMMAPELGKTMAAAGGAAAGSGAVVSAIEGLKQTTQEGIDSRPSAKEIGSATGKKLEQAGEV